MAASENLPNSIEISSRCLLRYYIALSMEAARLDHCQARADKELNKISGRMYSAKQWLAIIEPYYLERFCKTGLSPLQAAPPSAILSPLPLPKSKQP